MLSCSSCLRRFISLFAADLPSTPPILLAQTTRGSPRRSVRQSAQRSPIPSRSATTLRGLSKGHHVREALKYLKKDTPIRPSGSPKARRLQDPVSTRNRAARENNANHLLTPSAQTENQRKAVLEAQYLVDPLRLANTVLQNLQEDSFDKALELVRASDAQGAQDGKQRGGVNNVVSWNHLMDYTMYQKDPKQAMKIYNEMKKRGHRPDAHTYTIMLRGFGDNVRRPHAVNDALKVYNSIFAPNSDVKPSIIHTNCMVRVCARAGDLESLWGVTARMPEYGDGQADARTYTAILNALQNDVMKRLATLRSEEGLRELEAEEQRIVGQAIGDGRKLWRDVIAKWRNADLVVDESLVCAMGRLLLLSKNRTDVLDVLNLVKQTMNINRPRSGVTYAPEKQDEQQPAEEVEEGEERIKGVPHVEDDGTVFYFQPLEGALVTNAPAAMSQEPRTSLYAQPQANTLSMLLEAATLARDVSLGKAYWSILTAEFGSYAVSPDVQNILAYLRLLRISRSSSAALELLQKDWPQNVQQDLYKRGTFVIAMSTCVRDKNNPNSASIAGQIVDMMYEKAAVAGEVVEDDNTLEEYNPKEQNYSQKRRQRRKVENQTYGSAETLEVDPKVLAMYLNLAVYHTKGINPKIGMKKLPNGDLDFDRDPKTNLTFQALRRLAPDMVNVRRLLKNKIEDLDSQRFNEKVKRGEARIVDYPRVKERLEDLAGLVRAMISAYDRILAVNFKLEDEGMGPLESGTLNAVRLQKAKLAGYLNMVDKDVRKGLGKDAYDLKKVDGGDQESEDGLGAGNEDASQADSNEKVEMKPDAITSQEAKLYRETKRLVRRREDMEANRRLSRRQVQEKDKLRRQEKKMYLTNEQKSMMGKSVERRMRTGMERRDKWQATGVGSEYERDRQDRRRGFQGVGEGRKPAWKKGATKPEQWTWEHGNGIEEVGSVTG